MKTTNYITDAMQATIDDTPAISVDDVERCIRCDGQGEVKPDAECKRCEGTGIENHQAPIKIFTITENGFSMTNNKVSVPACKIKAISYLEAAKILDEFLSSRTKPNTIELITPIERIDFE